MSDQGTVEAEVERGAERLESAADALYETTMTRGKAEVVFERARLTALAKMHAESENGKLPAQDIRAALVFPLLSNEWDAFYVAKYTEEAVEKRYRALAHSVSTRQSVLRSRGTLG